MELLVGSVQVVVGKAEAHHDGGNLQSFVEVVDDGDRSPAADEHRFFLECIVQRFGCGLDVWIVGTDHGGRTFAPDFNFGLDTFRRKLLHKVGVLLEDVVGILVRYQAHGNFGCGFGGNHCLGTGGDESAGHAVNFERGSRPGAIENRVAGFAGEDFRADFRLAVGLLVKWQALPGLEFIFAGRLHALVEAGDQHVALGIL